MDTTIRFLGDGESMAKVAAVLSSDPSAELLGSGPVEAGPGADFALETLVAVVGLVSTAFFDGPIVPTIWKLLSGRSKVPEGTTIVIQSPTQSVKIESSADLTQAQVQEALGILMTP